MKIRVIPTILTDGQTVVKGTKFDNWRTVGMAQATAQLFSKRDVDELMFLDVKASERRLPIPESLIKNFTQLLNVPFSLGGGIEKVSDAAHYLNAGAEKIVLGRSALNTPKLITSIADKFGSQAVVVALDIFDYEKELIGTNCGTLQIKANPIKHAKALESLGAGEILLQSISRDGEMLGMDETAIREISNSVRVPIIASSGAGKLEDFEKAVRCGASAVAAGAVFQFTEITPKRVRDYLASNNIPVRSS